MHLAPDVYRCVSRLTENAGFQEQFFTDPSRPPPTPPQPPKPDPQAQAAQAMSQAELRASKTNTHDLVPPFGFGRLKCSLQI